MIPKLLVIRLPSVTVLLVMMYILLNPILAYRKTSKKDEFMVANERTRMRQNYVLQRPFNKDLDNEKIDVPYASEPLDPKTNPDELPALIVDYANMIRNDIILLDNSIETKTRKRGNIKVEKYNQGEITDIPCNCEYESREAVILGDDYVPRSLEMRICNKKLCPSPYKCQERLHNITILKRKRSTDAVEDSEELPQDLGYRWIAIKKPVTVGCLCLRDYNDRN